MASGTCKDNLTWTLSSGTLTIKGTGQMVPPFDGMTLKSQAPWINYREKIHTVIIDDGVTSIGIQAFDGCTNLTSVTIPNGVTFVGAWAFSGCNNLADIYYGGDESQWNQISIVTKVSFVISIGDVLLSATTCNVPLTNATKHYNSDLSN